MSKINPGSNFNGDNEVQNAGSDVMRDAVILEPRVDDMKKLHCPLCEGVFNTREDYISHSLAKHQPVELNCDEKGCT